MIKKNKYLLAILGILLAGFGCWYFSKILFYIVFAAFLTLIGKPFQNAFRKIRIKKRALPEAIIALLTLISIYGIFAGLFSVFIPLVANEARIISNINSDEVVRNFQGPIHSIENTLVQFSTSPVSLETYASEKLSSLLSAGQVTDFANIILRYTGNIFIAFFAISFFTFFFIKDGKEITETILLLSPEGSTHHIRSILQDAKHLLVKYFTGICIDVLCVSVLISLGLYFLGVQNALIIGFFAGLMNIIPYVGPLIAGLFGLIVTVSTNLQVDPYTVLLPLCEKMVLIFICVNLMDAFIIQPLIFSSRVKAHPLEIFIVVLMAGTLAGIAGMIIAVPFYTVLRVTAKEFFSRFRIIEKMTKNLD